MSKAWYRVGVFLISLCLVVILLLPNSVASAATQRKTLLAKQDTTIRQGQVVEDVLVLGHDVTVSGDVSEILVVIDGNVHLTSTSRTGIVVDLGGTILQDKGADVNAIYRAALHTAFWNGVLFGGSFALLVWAGLLAGGIGLIILSVLICVGLRKYVQTPLHQIERSVRRVGVTGILVSLAATATSSLFAVTIVGLPLAATILVLYLVAGVIGFAISSLWLGKLATRNSFTVDQSIWIMSLLGSSLIVAFTFIPFIGLLLFCIFWLIGVGAVTSWLNELWSSRQQKKRLNQ